MTSSINTLIGTFSSIDINNSNSSTTIDSSNLICIDTSNNRIGINTIEPLYSIHIEKNTQDSTDAISTPKLHITDISILTVSPSTMSSIGISFEIYCDASGYLRMRT